MAQEGCESLLGPAVPQLPCVPGPHVPCTGPEHAWDPFDGLGRVLTHPRGLKRLEAIVGPVSSPAWLAVQSWG